MPESISCVATSSQHGARRFAPSDERPRLNPWRCDLTALSQSYNFYFVACSDAIYVYEPSFPDQRLPKKPALIISPPISGPNLGWALDPQTPHSINRLHVDFLGREEIILVACDDGDVIGYHLSAIQRTIQSRPPSSPTVDQEDTPAFTGYVRPFFHRNVEASAWGLAVHRQARLIAISANPGRVTVIAFALTNSEDDVDQPLPLNKSTGLPNIYNGGDAPRRGRPDRIITLAAGHNIPSVSFDNNGTDPSGRWLFSSCINGATHLWDLLQPGRPAQVIRLGYCTSVLDTHEAPSRSCLCGSVAHAAWGAMFVDPRSCHQNRTINQALGGFGTERSPNILDITNLKLQRLYASDILNMPLLSNANVFQESEDEEEEEEEGEGEDDDDDNDNDDDNGLEEHELEGGDDQDEDDMSIDEGQVNVDVTQTLGQGPSGQTIHQDTVGDTFSVPENNDTEGSSEDTQEETSSTESDDGMDDILHHGGLLYSLDANITPVKKFYCDIEMNNGFLSSHPLPLSVIMTKEEIYLLQPGSNLTDGQISPIFAMRNPLYTPDSFRQSSPDDRLNYSLYIPELGAFLIASMSGRCAIFSLTSAFTIRDEKLLKVYAFRQEHLLPLSEQESNHSIMPHPNAKLVGIAAGPIQGNLKTPGSDEDWSEMANRKWRLMVLYQDHTVLSYELEKRHEDVSLSLADVVV